MHAVVTGLVLPAEGDWYFEEPIVLPFEDAVWHVVVRRSQFHVFIDGEIPDDVGTFLNEVESIVQGCVDSLGFHVATALRAEIRSMIVDGSTLVLRDTKWSELLNDPDKNRVPAEEVEPFVKASVEVPLVRFALADLRASLVSPDDSAFLAYRAIESIRQWFLQDSEDVSNDRDTSWVELRQTLNVNRADLDVLRLLANRRRHGGSQPLTANERKDAITLARIVVERFVKHLSAPKAA